MSILTQNTENKQELDTAVSRFLLEYKIGRLLTPLQSRKRKRYFCYSDLPIPSLCRLLRQEHVHANEDEVFQIALITTNVDLSEAEIIRIYGKRWNTELFYKACKSHLNLGKGCCQAARPVSLKEAE